MATQVAKRSYLKRFDSVIREGWQTGLSECRRPNGPTGWSRGQVRFACTCGWEPSVRKPRLRAASLSQLKLLEYVGTFLVLSA